MVNQHAYVLIPGGGMSDWIWKDLVPLLDDPFLAIDQRLTENTLQERKSATLHSCVEKVLREIRGKNFSKLTLVGHSIGGLIAGLVAQEIPEKIKAVFYLGANLPEDKHTPLSHFPLPLRWMNTLAVKLHLNQTSRPAFKLEKNIRKYFCNHCKEETIQYVLHQELYSEPLCLLSQKVNWIFPRIFQETYVRLSLDKTLSLTTQNQMAKNLGIKNLVEITADHMVMLSAPRALAGVLCQQKNG